MKIFFKKLRVESARRVLYLASSLQIATTQAVVDQSPDRDPVHQTIVQPRGRSGHTHVQKRPRHWIDSSYNHILAKTERGERVVHCASLHSRNRN